MERKDRPMDTWKREKAGEGRYHIRGADGIRRPGVVMGGGKTWAAELAGQTIGYYPTAAAACAALYRAAEPVYRGGV